MQLEVVEDDTVMKSIVMLDLRRPTFIEPASSQTIRRKSAGLHHGTINGGLVFECYDTPTRMTYHNFEEAH